MWGVGIRIITSTVTVTEYLARCKHACRKKDRKKSAEEGCEGNGGSGRVDDDEGEDSLVVDFCNSRGTVVAFDDLLRNDYQEGG